MSKFKLKNQFNLNYNLYKNGTKLNNDSLISITAEENCTDILGICDGISKREG